MNTMREEFEAWVIPEFGLDVGRGGDGRYESKCVESAWQAWQAARQPVGEVVAWQVFLPRTMVWRECTREVHESLLKPEGVKTRALYATPPQQPERVDLAGAARAAIPFVAYAFSEGVIGAEESGRAIESALESIHPRGDTVSSQFGLGQFRYSVKRCKSCLENHMHGDPAVISREISECDRLLALINQQESKP